MFTGIVQEMGRVSVIDRRGGITRMGIASETVARNSGIGDSISVNGVCLTVTSLQGGVMHFDLSAETMRSTNLGGLNRGDPVNLEPALRPSDRLGGHFVTGHIDGVGVIRNRRRLGEATEIEIGAGPEVTDYVVKKGSIAIDGISLTVVDTAGDSFTVVVIPHTEKVTTIGRKGVNDTVNLEADILGKYVARFLHRGERGGGKDEGLLSALSRSGFL